MKNILILLVIGVFTQSCAALFETRSFQSEIDRESDGLWVAGEDFALTAGDHGQIYRDDQEIMKRTPASNMEARDIREQSALREELRSYENRLTESQFRSYRNDRDHLATVSERIYYLKLPVSERSSYIRSKMGEVELTARGHRYGAAIRQGGVSGYDEYNPVNIWKLGKEISKGMTKGEVQSVLGSPDRVDVAGNPRLENERWIYTSRGKIQYVYFEAGSVNGWALD